MARLWSKVTFWRVVAAATLAAGAYATVVRFVMGLGASSNMSDGFPWGIWIGFDILVGVGLAAGGFTITATVHLLDLERYRPIVRPTVLTAFLGYLLAIAGLLFDLGRPDRVWHPMFWWNPHSVMFEIGWCVMLYTTVLALEFSPMILEPLGYRKPLRVIHLFTVPLVLAGVMLSTLHQSSLGSLFLIFPGKLHAFWYSLWLPVLFFLSAVAAGLSMVILESFLSARAFGRRLELPLLEGLARVVVVVLTLYLVVRFQDLGSRSALDGFALTTGEEQLFALEVFFGSFLPMILLSLPPVRRDRTGLFCSALLVVLGFVLNRLNTAVTGREGTMDTVYFPTWMEFAVTASLVCAGFIAFALAARYLNVFTEEPARSDHRFQEPRGKIGARIGQLALTTFGVAIVVAALKLKTPAVAAVAPVPAEPVATKRSALTLPPDLTFPAGKDSPGVVKFKHRSHVSAGRPDCAVCHAGSFPMMKTVQGIASAGSDRMHGADRCGGCHDGKRAFAYKEYCEACHTPRPKTAAPSATARGTGR
ncbi:MAG: Ni/Fe-hydrogenase cytochrome b subunit [Candidatus Riflebacteria bacterium]|nr:Ni/Fe-hydrogenase cytochrome b subunit [Candidatus Riflebacteria bacterium]